MTIRVLLADDQPLIRASLQAVITDAPGLEVAAEAGNGAQAVQLARETHPDVIVMDIRMPGMDGIEATRRIMADAPDAHVLVLTTFDDDEYIYGALRAGASGFVVKDMALDDILAAIHIVAAGDALIAPSITRRLIRRFTQHPDPGAGPAGPAPASLAGLTSREKEILTLIGRGLSNTEIAGHLVITVATVKAHITRLLAKLGARDRVHLVITAYENGLVPQRR